MSTWPQVRLLLRGRFLDDNYSLISKRISNANGALAALALRRCADGRFIWHETQSPGLRIPAGQTTVMHLVPRADGLPEKPRTGRGGWDWGWDPDLRTCARAARVPSRLVLTTSCFKLDSANSGTGANAQQA